MKYVIVDKISVFIILFLLSFFCNTIWAQDKQFDYGQYANRSRIENYSIFQNIVTSITEMDSIDGMHEFEKMRQAGIRFDDKEMELEAVFDAVFTQNGN